MTLVIALALLITFTWFASRRDESGEPGWATLAGPGPARTAPRRTNGPGR